MPVDRYLAGYTNSWLAILHEYSDRATYEDDPVWKAERAAESNWSRPRPSSAEIARMETAIVWPARYLGHVPQLLRTVQAVALFRARHGNIAHAARKLALPGRLCRRWNGEGSISSPPGSCAMWWRCSERRSYGSLCAMNSATCRSVRLSGWSPGGAPPSSQPTAPKAISSLQVITGDGLN